MPTYYSITRGIDRETEDEYIKDKSGRKTLLTPVLTFKSQRRFLFGRALIYSFSFLFKNNCGKSGRPCRNNATCLSGFTPKGYRCSCTLGFEGENCEYGKYGRRIQHIATAHSIGKISLNIEHLVAEVQTWSIVQCK